MVILLRMLVGMLPRTLNKTVTHLLSCMGVSPRDGGKGWVLIKNSKCDFYDIVGSLSASTSIFKALIGFMATPLLVHIDGC